MSIGCDDSLMRVWSNCSPFLFLSCVSIGMSRKPIRGRFKLQGDDTGLCSALGKRLWTIETHFDKQNGAPILSRTIFLPLPFYICQGLGDDLQDLSPQSMESLICVWKGENSRVHQFLMMSTMINTIDVRNLGRTVECLVRYRIYIQFMHVNPGNESCGSFRDQTTNRLNCTLPK
jgi:hypothetical protein